MCFHFHVKTLKSTYLKSLIIIFVPLQNTSQLRYKDPAADIFVKKSLFTAITGQNTQIYSTGKIRFIQR
jgi:hypothetical protein